MKKKLTQMLCMALTLTTLLMTGAMAAEAPDAESGGSSAAWSEASLIRLQGYPYTAPERALTYSEAQERYSADILRFFYGDRSDFGSFTNAHEHLYHTMERGGTYCFRALGKTLTGSDNESFFKTVAEEAAAEIGYQSERLSVVFHTDEALLYQGDGMDRTTACVRGIAEVTLHVKPTELEGVETALLCRLGFTQLYQGKAMYIDLDVHMNTQPNYDVNIHTIAPLGEAYE